MLLLNVLLKQKTTLRKSNAVKMIALREEVLLDYNVEKNVYKINKALSCRVPNLITWKIKH